MSEAVRRVAAIFLPELACEIAGWKVPPATGGEGPDLKGSPLAVVDAPETCLLGRTLAAHGMRGEESTWGDVILALNESARRYGVREGQKVAEARALVARLVIRGISAGELRRALGRVADVVLEFGPTACIESADREAPLDTVWVDLTGTSHLWGSETAVVNEIGGRMRELGHRAKIAIADGPRLARAAAAYSTRGNIIVDPSRGEELMRSLPLEALPLPRERIVWLHRLGLWTVGDLTELPFSSLVSRLGERWKETIDLARGEDTAPLIAYQPPRTLAEETAWDEPVGSIEPLLFTLRGLTSHLAVRLEGRGEAAQAIQLFARYDRSIARARDVREEGLAIRVDLPAALSHAPDLFRVLRTKLEHAALAAPVTGLCISVALLTRASRTQLSLDEDKTQRADPRSMAVFLAEVSAEIGAENVGVLELLPVHRPEARTKLVPLATLSRPRTRALAEDGEALTWISGEEFPTRLLPEPVPLPIFAGQKPMVSIDNQLYAVEGKSHPLRLDAIEWWTPAPVCRDYSRLLLTSGKKSVRAWVFTDRTTGRAFLHGYFD